MAAGYCIFHQKDLTKKEIKYKRCRCKSNTKKRCRHFVATLKQKYRNDTNFRGGMTCRKGNG